MIAEDKINDQRQLELDVAKGLAILFMLNIHVLMTFASSGVDNSSFGRLVHFLGGPPAAPVFMFAMGVGVAYSRKSSYRYFLNRGVKLLLVGYLLNIFRYLIPLALGLEFNIIQMAELEYGSLLNYFMFVDILQFAGLSLIVIAIIKKMELSILFYPLAALLFPLLNYLVQDLKTSSEFVNSLLGLFWGSSVNSFFPLLSWIFYPLIGVFFGHFLIRCSNKNKLYLLVAGIAVLVFLTAGAFAGDLGMVDDYNYYHHDLLGNLTIGAMIALWISFLYFISKLIPKLITNKLEYWSRKITHFYLIHWLIIGWSLLVFGYNNLNFWPTVAVMLGLIVITDRVTYFIEQHFKFRI